MTAATYFYAGLVFVSLVIGAGILIDSNDSLTGGTTAKTVCSGGHAVTDGQGNFCYMSSGSCGSNCLTCETRVQTLSPEKFAKRCAAGR